MTAVPSYFTDFLDEIRLTPEQRKECEEGHKTLRGRLEGDAVLSKLLVSTFLQGSYRRRTGVRPSKAGDHLDVDVVVVTNLDPTKWSPKQVLEDLFRPFLDTWYRDQWEVNDRSIKITPAGGAVTIDLVPTSAPSQVQQDLIRAFGDGFRIEARGDAATGPLVFSETRDRITKMLGSATWQPEPLMIPSRDLGTWRPTHPLAQILWTEAKGGTTGGHYVNVVKAIKWWRRKNPQGEYPKGYPLEHLVGQACPDGIDSVALGVVGSLEAIRDNYRAYAMSGMVPPMRDHGVDHNVFARITAEQFRIFWDLVNGAASQARAAYDAATVPTSAAQWRVLFGPEFPEPKVDPTFPAPGGSATPTRGRFG